MRANIKFWRSIGAPDFIIDSFQQGYKIMFITSPVPANFQSFQRDHEIGRSQSKRVKPFAHVLLDGLAKFKINRSALNNSDFVTEAINDLLAKDLISEILKLDIVNLLTASIQSSGKKHLILDLQYVNHNIWKQKTKFEDWTVAIQYYNQGSFIFSYDLQSGNHQIDIFPEHRRFLSFSRQMYGTSEYFSFNVLPFGLSSAPYIFTKMFKGVN